MSVGLSAIRSWDLAALRGGAGSLAEVPDRLSWWRLRLDGMCAQLQDPDLWSGPAADVAVTALVELSAVAQQVQLALAGSVEALATVVDEAGTAQAEAEAARVVAATGPVPLSDQGVVPPIAAAGMAPDQLAAVADRERTASQAEAHARLALAAADAAALAAAAADAALFAARADGNPLTGGVDVDGSWSTGLPGIFAPPPTPFDASEALPGAAADWWAGLSPAARQAAIASDPAGVGALDGLPAWARDQANRMLLDDALAHPDREGYAVALETAEQLELLDTGQLLLFVPGEDLVALSIGDLDTAGAIGVLVPGMNTSPDDDLDSMTADATAVGELAAAAVPGLAVATVVWMGYRTPGWFSVPFAHSARSSGPVLDRTLDGIAAARASGARGGGLALPRTTLIAHSYGTVVAGEAARAEGELAADALVLLGSPGTGSETAEGLEADEVFGAWSASDVVSSVGYYGGSPADPGFGDTALPTDTSQGHSDYYDPEYPTVQAIAEVVAGTREAG